MIIENELGSPKIPILLSICVPTYKRPAWLKRTINSIKNTKREKLNHRREMKNPESFLFILNLLIFEIYKKHMLCMGYIDICFSISLLLLIRNK